MTTGTCFIAMPVSTSPADAERFGDTDHWEHVLHTVFVPAVEAAGFDPILPTAKGSDLIHSRIVKHLQEAGMVLCDLSSHNPNVFFELGVRTATNLPIALTCDQHTSLPFDTGGINTHKYDAQLDGWKTKAQVETLAAHLKSSAEACQGSNPLWRAFGLTLTATEPSEPESREEAQLELLAQEIAQIRGMLSERSISKKRPTGDGTARVLARLSDSSNASDELKAFAMNASNLSTESGRAVRWYRAQDNNATVYVPEQDYGEMHVTSRRMIQDLAANAGIEIVVIPA